MTQGERVNQIRKTLDLTLEKFGSSADNRWWIIARSMIWTILTRHLLGILCVFTSWKPASESKEYMKTASQRRLVGIKTE